MKKTIIRNLLFTLVIGMGTLSLPRLANACDAVCQCGLTAQQDYALCQQRCNSSPCNNCAGDQSACVTDFPCGEEASCDPFFTCIQGCTGAYDAARFDCHAGC
jgi:hypothetical protein